MLVDVTPESLALQLKKWKKLIKLFADTWCMDTKETNHRSPDNATIGTANKPAMWHNTNYVDNKNVPLFYTYWHLPTIKRARNIYMKYATNQSESRTTVSVNRSSNQRRERFSSQWYPKIHTPMKRRRRVSWAEWKKWRRKCHGSLSSMTVDDFINDQENKNTKAKTDRNIILLKTFLQMKNEFRNVEELPSANLDEFLSEFILTVRANEGKDYEPTSLRGMRNSFCKFFFLGKSR